MRTVNYFATLLGIVLTSFLYSLPGFSQTIPESFGFKLPLNNYNTNDNCLDWQDTNSSFPGTYHAGDDECVDANTDVFACANGYIRYARTHENCPNWGNLIVIESHTPDGNVCVIYGHTIASISEGTVVDMGDKIGTIGHYSCWDDHIHFAIHSGSYGASTGVYPAWLAGYVPTENWPNNYVNPVYFVMQHPADVGFFSDGWHTDGTSQAIVDEYNTQKANGHDLGQAYNTYWTAYAHTQNGITLQDFYNEDNEYNNSVATIVVNAAKNHAYTLREGFRYTYFTNNGIAALKQVESDEHSGDGHTTVQHCQGGTLTWDTTPSPGVLGVSWPMCITTIDRHNVTFNSEPYHVDIYNFGEYLGTTPFTTQFEDDSSYTLSARQYGYQEGEIGVEPEDTEVFIELTVAETNPPAVSGNFPMGIHGEYMYNVDVLIKDENDDVLVTNGKWWLRMDLTDCPTGWLMIKIRVKADGQINGQWPKMHLPWGVAADQEVNSTDWIDLFFYRYIQNEDWSYEIDLAESTRVANQYFIVDKSTLTYVNAPDDPELNVSAEKLTLGCIDTGSLSGNFTIKNSNTGFLTGTLAVDYPFVLSDSTFGLYPEAEQECTVSINVTNLERGVYRDIILVDSNGVEQTIILEAAKYTGSTVHTATFYSNAGDGRIQSYSDNSWANARSGADNIWVQTNQNEGCINSDKEINRYFVTKIFLPFNTAGLADNTTIIAARLIVTNIYTPYLQSGKNLRVVHSWPANVSALASTDYDSIGTVTGSGNDFAMSSMSANQAKTINLDATGMGWVDRQGLTNLGLRVVETDINNIVPTCEDYVYFYLNEASGIDHDPRLEIDYVVIYDSTYTDTTEAVHDTLIVQSTNADGRVQSYSDVSWSNCWNGANLWVDANNASNALNSDVEINRRYCTRIFLIFPTADLPDDAEIDSVKLRLTPSDASYLNYNPHVRLVAGTPSNLSQLTTADYSQVGSTTLSETDYAMTSAVLNQSFNLTLNTAGKSWINKTDSTCFALRVVETDVNNTAPSGADYIYLYLSEASGTNYDPQLTIFYTVGGEQDIDPDPEPPEASLVRYYSGSGDGRVQSYSDASWTAAHTGSGLQAEYTQATRYLNSDLESGRYYVTRIFLPFDTSDLPDEAVVDSVKFVFTEWDNPYIHSNQHIRLVEANQNRTSQLVTSDFSAVASVAGAPDLAMTATSSNTAVTMTMNATGLTWINTTGWTKLGLRVVESDINNSAPSTEDYIGLYFSEQSGTDKDPYIDVYYHESLSKKAVKNILPATFLLTQNYPNPFNPVTTIEYNLPKSCNVKLQVFNAVGQLVTTLVDGSEAAGLHRVNWQALDHSSGLYFFVFQGGEFSSVKKAVLMK
ncbi:MAG TPA: peptidoglycan DD-metalloendopeptidase family protein [bacterium]|nr:peptidoglycan DD-metalloendopeptidase family protein [bacterium]